ncbi:hypothetical protein GcM3_069034, partial [Golovinomyces cichoracearum]
MSLNNMTNNDLTVSPTMPSILTENHDNLRYNPGSPDDTQYFNTREDLVNFARARSIKPKLGSNENLVSTVEPRKIAASSRREDLEVMLLSRDISNLRSKKIRD